MKIIKNIKKDAFSIVAFAMLMTYSLLIILPLLWVFVNSFKGKIDFIENIFGLPDKWLFTNYTTSFKELYVTVRTADASSKVFFGEMMLNTVLYSVGATVASTFIPLIVSYACARFKFRVGKIIYTTVIITMLLPIVGSLPSEMQVVRALGLYDNLIGVWVLKSNFLGMFFLIFFASWKSISREYNEAAEMDGAGNFRILFNIMIPLVMPTVLAVGLMRFIGFWNEYYTPMVFIPSRPTIAYGLYLFNNSVSNAANSIPVQLAGCMAVALPMIVLFVIMRNKIMGNISVGGIKG